MPAPSQTSTADKVHINRLRAAAARQGLIISKSRMRDPRALEYDKWAIFDEEGDPVIGVDNRNRYTMTLNEVEEYLNS